MIITPLRQEFIPSVVALMDLGTPYVRTRTGSDYWLYARLFSSTCPVALIDDNVAGAAIAFRSQDQPEDIYVQDVMVHPDHRRRGVASALIEAIRARAAGWGCARLYLTSEPDNAAAHAAWCAMGFVNLKGDRTIDGISVITDFKGPGKSRAVYELGGG